MKLTFIFIFTTIISFSQKLKEVKIFPENPRDTVYYKDGQIRSIEYEHEYFRTHGSKLHVFFDSICDKSIQKQKLRYSKTEDRNEKESRYYFEDSLVIRKTNYKNHHYKHLSAYQLYFNTKKVKPLNIHFAFNKKDSLVESVFVNKPMEFKYFSNGSYFSTHFRKPTSLTNDMNITIDNERYLTINFREKYYMNWLVYSWKKNSKKKTYIKTWISFYEDNNPKEYGDYYVDYGRKGFWYFYYKNGRLKSKGKYCGSRQENNKERHLKEGKWIYYTEDGCIKKIERWNNGELLNNKIN